MSRKKKDRQIKQPAPASCPKGGTHDIDWKNWTRKNIHCLKCGKLQMTKPRSGAIIV